MSIWFNRPSRPHQNKHRRETNSQDSSSKKKKKNPQIYNFIQYIVMKLEQSHHIQTILINGIRTVKYNGLKN